jgi:hypothetical protein
MLQDCFDHMDWDMFRIASNNNIDVYSDSVSEVISKTFPNQKPWIDGSVRAKLKVRTTAFKSGQGERKHDQIQTVQLFPPQGNQTS